MAKTNKNVSMYSNLSLNLSDDQQFRLNKINKIRDYFVVEVKERYQKDFDGLYDDIIFKLFL